MKGGLEFLALLSELDVDWLLSIGRLEDEAVGSTLIAKGQTDADLILLIDGEASVVDPGSGKELARVGRGELLGEISFIDKKGAAASVVVTVAARVFRMPRSRLDEKLVRDPVFAGRFFRMIAGFLSGRLRSMVSPDEAAVGVQGEEAAKASLAHARLERLLHRFSPVGTVVLSGQDLTIEHVKAIAVGKAAVSLSQTAQDRVALARAVVDRLATSDRPIYGVNTGLGALKGMRVSPDEAPRFQRNILLSHAVGIPPEYAPEVSRAIMAARLNGMARGGAGISPHVLAGLAELLNRDVVPVIPKRGSVGMADLAPLAHMALPLIGEGEVWARG
ncbi:MAG: aromatic amino acid lyase, partial [Proteobacteria bacterium]|nr:aromatic amino acid lyase [Pseudomonadota bacterium]